MSQFLLLLTPKQPKLTPGQFQTLVTIAIEAGVIGAAVVAIPTLFDRGSPLVVTLGIIITFGAWLLALWLSKNIS